MASFRDFHDEYVEILEDLVEIDRAFTTFLCIEDKSKLQRHTWQCAGGKPVQTDHQENLESIQCQAQEVTDANHKTPLEGKKISRFRMSSRS